MWMKAENVEVQQAPQVIPMLVILDYSSINEQWLKEVEILQILSFPDSQRIWEGSFEEEEIIWG